MDSDILTIAQQVFALFYAIFLGIMIQTTGARFSIASSFVKKVDKEEGSHDATLNLFDTPNAWAIGFNYKNKPFLRAVISILFLNIIPGLLFAFVFNDLKNMHGNLTLAQFVLIIFISLSPQYIYRIYYAILVHWHDWLYLKEMEFPDYNHHDLYAREILRVNRSQYEGHKKFINHAAFPVFIFFPLLSIFYILSFIQNRINPIFYGASLGIMLSGIFLFLFQQKEGGGK